LSNNLFSVFASASDSAPNSASISGSCLSVFFQQFLSFIGDGNVHQPFIAFANHFLQALCYQPINDAAGVAHFIKHALPDLQR